MRDRSLRPWQALIASSSAGHKGPFSWDKYLSETKATAVPGRLFRPRQLCPGWRRGLRLEAVDPLNPRLVRVATVASLQPPQGLLLHWDGWPPGPAGDCFVDEDSPDIHPAGWCAKTGHPLEPPPSGCTRSLPSASFSFFF